MLKLIPRRLRDWAYERVANNRYRWFGRQEQCLLPQPQWRERFVE
jgi:predicted DCC family thiol-disulfide oxidoreductase YuxK